MEYEIISSLLYRCTYIHKHYNNVHVHEISSQATSKPLYYRCKTTPSYTLVSGHLTGMKNLNPSLRTIKLNIITGT